MPWPGYGTPRAGASLLPWEWAEQRLAGSRRYWVASARADGTPHLAAVWAVWVDGALCFSTGRLTRKARNLAARPRCTVATESGEEAVVLEGDAVEVPSGPERDLIDAAYAAKYGSSMLIGDSPVIAVRGVLVSAVVDGDAPVLPTRWRLAGG